MQAGADLNERDIFAEPLTVPELEGLASLSSSDDMFSWNSPSARARNLRRGALPHDELIGLMAAEPRLIRRPLAVSEGRLAVGAGSRELDAMRALLGE